MNTGVDGELLQWLLAGDPAIRWRVLQGLTSASDQDVARQRAWVGIEGWGARLLAAQDRDGGWGGGVYSPKWTSTTSTLLRLLWLGLPSGHPAAVRGCERLWEWQASWRVPETCIVGILVRLTSSHGYDAAGLDAMVGYLVDQQLADGGWNCATRADKGKHSSFHTSIQALEALDAYTSAGGRVDASESLLRGREFFLTHRLYQSHRTGAVAIRGSTRFPAFPEWHFDVLRGLQHFAQGGAQRDERLRDVGEVLRRTRREDGRWPAYSPYPGRQWSSWSRQVPAGGTPAAHCQCCNGGAGERGIGLVICRPQARTFMAACYDGGCQGVRFRGACEGGCAGAGRCQNRPVARWQALAWRGNSPSVLVPHYPPYGCRDLLSRSSTVARPCTSAPVPAGIRDVRRGVRKPAVYDRAMGLFRSRARKNRGKAAAELLKEQAMTATAQAEVARREVIVEERPNPDQPGWGRTIGQEIGKAREDRPSQE